ncbi:HAD family hydrolase [Methanocella conradii]|uniref:HAD family hydrolase n=1 Tax=Methanocella conradii TaxID=1175444 RepID=UPI00157BE367|nr:HAD family hydrolase [Methanocella conradii]
MITTILFDIYGTLIDIVTDESDPSAYEAISKWLEYKYIYLSADQLKWLYREEFARRLGTEEARRRIEVDIFKNIIEEFEARMGERRELYPDADVRDVFKSIILRFASRTPEELDHLSTDLSHLFRSSTRKHIFLYPTVKPALEQMQKRYRLGIVSNAQEAFTLPELGLYDLTRYFETIVLSSEVGVKKPNSMIFARALSNLNVKPSEAVMVGNDMTADMIGASKLGMKTILVSQRSKPEQQIRGIRPDAVVSNVNLFEVLSLVDAWNASRRP